MNILRWIIFFPLAVVMTLLVNFPVHWVLFQTLSGGDDPLVTPYPELPEKILSPFFRGLVFVWIGSRVVPSYKLASGIVLGCVWSALSLVISAMAYLEIPFFQKKLMLEYYGFPVLLGIIGCYVGVILVRRKINEIA